MPKLPCEATGTCGFGKVALHRIKTKTKKYGIFAVLIIELISLFLYNSKDYLTVIYPFMANATIFILLYKNYCDRVELKYCQRAKIALIALCLYFFIGGLAVVFKPVGILYNYYIDYVLLLTAFICILLTIYKNK